MCRGAVHSVEGVSATKCEKLIRAVDLFQSRHAVLDNLGAGSRQWAWVRGGSQRSTDLCEVAVLASLEAASVNAAWI